ncbi:MAG: hypothetical protein ACYSSI_02075 [Planctomycetota bacterium]|jgi:Tfp pilus assembly protein PilN
MFTIDLLAGSGVPIRSSPKDIAILGTIAAIPFIAAIIMLIVYFNNNADISIAKQQIANYERQITKFADAVKLQEKLKLEKTTLNTSLSEIGKSIGRHTQWSPVLEAVVSNFPDSMKLDSLEVKQRSTRVKRPREDDPKKKVDMIVPIRTLHLTVSGNPRNNCDKAVMELSNSLRNSDVLKAKLQDIKVSQKTEKHEGQDVVSYKIDCLFEPEI